MATSSTTAPTTSRRIAGTWNQRHRMIASAAASSEVSTHLIENTVAKKPLAWEAAPQLANTRIPTITPKNVAVCHSGRTLPSSGTANAAAFLSRSPLRKMNAIRKPMTILKATAPMARAAPSCAPSTLAVMITASTLIAGPAYRNVVAGPMPAPIR